MNTASQQSAGGSQAGAVGQGALLASRTRNAGSADAAIADSTRKASQTLGNDALKTQMANADLEQKQRQAGIGGLESLYGTQLGDANSALGVVPSAVNADTNAENASWDWSSALFQPLLGAAGNVAGKLIK